MTVEIEVQPAVRRLEGRAPSFRPAAAALGAWAELQAALLRQVDPVPCSVSPAGWFPVAGSAAERAAVAACRSCPVVQACAAYVVAAGAVESGVWGGLTEVERFELRRAERAS